MGLNDKNTYRNSFTPGTNCDSTDDKNNFVYVSQSNKFDKDVWNYNTKQTSLYIDNLKKIINFTDNSDSKPEISGSTISNSSISGSTISDSGINISKNRNLSLGTKDSDEDICTKLNPHDVGPAFNTKIKSNSNDFMSISNWKFLNQVGAAIYHNGEIYCVKNCLQEVHFRFNWTDGAGYYLASVGYANLGPGVGWSGAITVMNYQGNTGNFRAGNILADGDLVATVSVHTPVVHYDSDKKLKSNIATLSTDESLKLITSLEPKSYSFKKDKDQKIRYGFIAQEVEKVLQNNNLKNTGLVNYQLLKTNEDVTANKDKYKDEEMNLSLSYTDLIAPTIAVVQYQQKEIESLKKEINELKQIISNK